MLVVSRLVFVCFMAVSYFFILSLVPMEEKMMKKKTETMLSSYSFSILRVVKLLKVVNAYKTECIKWD